MLTNVIMEAEICQTYSQPGLPEGFLLSALRDELKWHSNESRNPQQ